MVSLSNTQKKNQPTAQVASTHKHGPLVTQWVEINLNYSRSRWSRLCPSYPSHSTVSSTSGRQDKMQVLYCTERTAFSVPTYYLKEQCHEIFDIWFFHQTTSPRPQTIAFKPFWKWLGNREDIRLLNRRFWRKRYQWHRCPWYSGVNDTAVQPTFVEYLHEFEAIFDKALTRESEAQMGVFDTAV
jgi:hypothetical protein